MRKHTKTSIKIKIAVLFLIFIFLFNAVESNVRNSIKQISMSNSNIVATQIITNAVSNQINKMNVDYNDIVIIEYNNENQISSVQIDNFFVNELQNNINNEIVNDINNLDNTEIDVSLGSLTGSKWFYARGPKLTMKVIPMGKMTTKIVSEFEDSGINQTIHKLYLDVELEITTLLGFYSTNEKVNLSVPIAETIIVGNVPQYYTNVAGQSEETISKINDYNPSSIINIE